MTQHRIVIADDEEEIAELLSLYLSMEGYAIEQASNGREAVELVRRVSPDLVILDVLMPELDGIAACEQIRTFSNVPILFISCKTEDNDKIHGLGVGGDDYIAKPFSPGELVARVKAHLRRSGMQSSNAKAALPGLEIDHIGHMAWLNGNLLSLSAKEFEILRLIADNPNRVFNIEELFQLVWKSDSLGDTRTVMVHISNLRKKLEDDPSNPKYILTVRGIGYKLSGDVPIKIHS